MALTSKELMEVSVVAALRDRQRFGDEKYGPNRRTNVSWLAEGYVETIDLLNYLDYAYESNQLDAGDYWEARSHVMEQMHILQSAKGTNDGG